jgi:hypothetical protein
VVVRINRNLEWRLAFLVLTQRVGASREQRIHEVLKPRPAA